MKRRPINWATTGDPCAECNGPVMVEHGPYVDDDGQRICAICNLKRHPGMSEIMTRVAHSFAPRARPPR